MKKLLLTLFVLFNLLPISAQITTDYIKNNSIVITSPDSLNNQVYNKINHFELIMIGEQHGTWEPSLLVKGMAKKILDHEDKVCVGIEIPRKKMLSFIDNPTDSILLHDSFFSRNTFDGRNGKAWLSLVQFCYKNPSVILFFFDNPPPEVQSEYLPENNLQEDFVKNLDKRDKGMYLSILEIRKKHPKYKIVTLSGNFHNQFVLSDRGKSMGSFCYNDSVDFDSKRILSIDHRYSEGTTLNSLGFSTIEYKKNIEVSS